MQQRIRENGVNKDTNITHSMVRSQELASPRLSSSLSGIESCQNIKKKKITIDVISGTIEVSQSSSDVSEQASIDSNDERNDHRKRRNVHNDSFENQEISLPEYVEEHASETKRKCLNLSWLSDESSLGRLRRICGKIVENSAFQSTIFSLILVNAIMMGIGTYDFVTHNEKVNTAFSIADLALLIIFTIECVLELIFKGWRFFLDGWLVFDFFTVVSSWALNSLKVIRSFRIFRALRLIKRIETVKELVGALIDVIPKVTAIMSLMMLIFYVFAVMFTSLFKNIPLSGNYFVRLDWTLLTLFQLVTLDWAEIARELEVEVPWAIYPIVLFIIMTAFIVYNLIVAVLCDAIFIMKDSEETTEDGVYGDDLLRLEKQINNLSSKIITLRESQFLILSDLEDLIKVLNEKGVIKISSENITTDRKSFRTRSPMVYGAEDYNCILS